MLKTKEKFRKEIISKLKTQAREEALKKSELIKKALFSLPEFKKARFVMFYASRPEEVNTLKMIDEAIEMGKKVALPRCTDQKTIIPKEIKERQNDLEKGTYGIYEPRKSRKNVQLEKIDLVIVPGVAFDKKNRRLGRGKGYYDRFLKEFPAHTTKIGLAFDFQLVNNLPHDSHDIPVSKVLHN